MQFTDPVLAARQRGHARLAPIRARIRAAEEFACNQCAAPVYVDDRAFLNPATDRAYCSRTCAQKAPAPQYRECDAHAYDDCPRCFGQEL